MMANTHCAQCSDTRNIYIKTCDCSKKRVNQQIDSKPNCIKKEFTNSSAVDQKKGQTEEPKLRAVKAVVYRVVRVYETVPSKTMKFVGAFTLLLLIVAVVSVAMAQNKEETKSQYGMAFPLEESNSEQRISIIGSVPGEGSQSTPETTSESPVTTTFVPTTEESVVTTEDSDKKLDDIENQSGDNPTLLMANGEDEDEKSGENGDEKTNPRLVFIERLMGLHLSSPFGEQKDNENEKEENSAVENEPPMPFRNPFDKVNAKWSTRMRKFSIPLMQQQSPQPPETPNPLLRVAAAAMMTRLLAAAARAHNNGPMMAKDKDDDAEEETVPILLATMRSDDNERGESMHRPMNHMYGRPMPRPAMMRPPMRPPIKFLAQPQEQRMASINVPQRLYSEPMMTQRSQLVHRPLPPVQPVLVMLAHVPVPMQMAESRMGGSPVQYASQSAVQYASQSPVQYASHPYYASQPHSMPIYPQVPYAVPLGYHPMQRQVMSAEVSAPMHMPIQVASYHRPVYQSPYQSAYQSAVPYQRQSSRPVIEIPIEIPIPVQVPVPVSYHNQQSQHLDADHDTSASEAEQVAIVYYDPEGNDGSNDEMSDHMEPQTSESHENSYSIAPSHKGNPYLSRPLPDIQSATKLKLWREYVGAKHAANPGVRYIPVAVSNDDSQTQPDSQDSSDSQPNHDNSETAESQSQPAFVILTDDSPADAPQHHR